MKILGVLCLGILIPNTIQLREYSMGGDTDGKAYVSDGNPNVLNSNRNDDGQWLNSYWDNPDNEWDDNGAFAFPVPQLSLFLSLISRESFLFYLTLPAAEHSSDLVELFGESKVLFVIQRLGFPENH